MDNRIRKAFEQVRASEDRKDRTRAFLAEKTRGYARRPRAASYPRRLAACLALLLSGSYWFCLAPAAEISIDVNPSVELAVNRLDQVVSVRGRNDDGRQHQLRQGGGGGAGKSPGGRPDGGGRNGGHHRGGPK